MDTLRLFAIAAVVSFATPAAAAVVAAPAFSPRCHVAAEVIGFSRNERVAALRYRASCPTADGGVDELVVGALAHVAAQTPAYLFYAEVPHHELHGHRTLLTPALLARRYPSLPAARNPAAWQQVLAQGHFSAVRHDFADASVRLQPEHPTDGLRVGAAHHAMTVQSASDVTFTVVGRLADGRHVPLASVHHHGRYVQAILKLAYSRGGHLLAAQWRDGAGHEQLHLLATPEGVRFGTNNLGAPSVVTGTADEVETLYKAMHPHTAKVWDENVGDAY